MMSEMLFVLKNLGLKKNLDNLKSMKHARSAIRGYLLTTCYWSLLEIGFLDELNREGSLAPEPFCRKNRMDAEILGFILEYLVRLRHLERQTQSVRFTRTGEKFWKETNGVLNIFRAYHPFFNKMTELLKGGKKLDDIERDDLAVALGFRETGARFTFDIMNRIIGTINPKGIIELGCGNIDLSLFVAKDRPGMKFLGIDYDKRFLDEADATIRSEKLSGRVTLLKKDIFDLSPNGRDFSSYDLVTAIDLFHGYFSGGDKKLLGLFDSLRKTFSGKKFLISEVCLPDEMRMARLAYPHAEHELFHHLTDQKTFREGELEELLTRSGFTIRKVWNIRNLAARMFILCEAPAGANR